MKIAYNYEDYLFLCSRINARMANLITEDKCAELASVKSDAEFYTQLAELGVAPETDRFGQRDFSRAPDARLAETRRDIFRDIPSPELFTVFTYPYDCHNLKSAVKATEKGISVEGLLIPMGSVDADRVPELVRTGDFSSFPASMAKAAPEAMETFARTRDPKSIDMIIDRACFADMAESLKHNPLKYFGELLKAKADTVNILTAVRLLRMESGNRAETMLKAYMPGGGLTEDLFAEIMQPDSGGETFLADRLKSKGYGRIAATLASPEGASLSDVGTICDLAYYEKAMETKGAVAGAEVVAMYLVMCEIEAKNLRILITGRRLGYSPEKIVSMLS